MNPRSVKNLLCALPVILGILPSHAGIFEWCYETQTPTGSTPGAGTAGNTCGSITNPRGRCGGGPLWGCSQGGTVVQYFVYSGVVVQNSTGAWICIGVGVRIPGIANC